LLVVVVEAPNTLAEAVQVATDLLYLENFQVEITQQKQN
jgi:hypothetical protein